MNFSFHISSIVSDWSATTSHILYFCSICGFIVKGWSTTDIHTRTVMVELFTLATMTARPPGAPVPPTLENRQIYFTVYIYLDLYLDLEVLIMSVLVNVEDSNVNKILVHLGHILNQKQHNLNKITLWYLIIIRQVTCFNNLIDLIRKLLLFPGQSKNNNGSSPPEFTALWITKSDCL